MKNIFQLWLVVSSALMAGLATGRAETSRQVLMKTAPQQDPYANDGVSFRVLCYHDVRDELSKTLPAWPESAAVDTRDFIDQLEWLRDNGYHPVSLDAILSARNGGPKLPSKPILLTFDDGYQSMYTRVFPILKLLRYPALFAVVGEWLEAGPDGKVMYGDRWMERDRFVTWPQVKEMVASGLVEVASHSHSLHKGVLANPQGNMISSAITRIYAPRTNSYESDAAYMARIRGDLARNSALIEHHLGKKPRVMIWPYGAYNKVGVDAAAAEGMPITMNLDAGSNTPDHSLSRVRRDILFFNDKVTDLRRSLNQHAALDGVEHPLQRIAAVELDAIYDPDARRQEEKLGALIERMLRLRINTVYLRAVADVDGDGIAEAAYFPNRHLPMRADLFSRVAWQLRTRAAVAPDFINIYAWIPIQALQLPVAHPKAATEIYEDLGKNAPRIAGVVFGADHVERPAKLTPDLAAAFKAGQPNAMTVLLRTLPNLLTPGSRDLFARSLATDLNQFDFAALMAAPDSNRGRATEAALRGLVNIVRLVPAALDRTVILLDGMATPSRLPSERLATHLRFLQHQGVRNFGYYPDNVVLDYPALSAIRPVVSLQSNPGVLK